MLTPTLEVEEGQKSPSPFTVFCPSRLQWSFLVAQSSLRALAAASTLVALSIMVTSEESVVIFGIRLEAHYYYSSAFRFLLGVDSIVFAFSVLSMVFLCRLNRLETNFRHYYFLFLHDLVITVLMISGCSAASAVGYVGQYGEEKMGWLSVCNRVAKFCNRVMVSVVLSYLACFCYFALSITSAHKLTLLSAR